ncbi:hypothetical protein Tco_0930044 [Tanacetum coccineum]
MINSNTPSSSSFINHYQHSWHLLEPPFPKPPRKPKINIIPPKQLFVDLTHDDTKTPSPTLQLSSPSALNAPCKTPSTKDTSSSSIDYIPKSPTSSTSLSPNAKVGRRKRVKCYVQGSGRRKRKKGKSIKSAFQDNTLRERWFSRSEE